MRSTLLAQRIPKFSSIIDLRILQSVPPTFSIGATHQSNPSCGCASCLDFLLRGEIVLRRRSTKYWGSGVALQIVRWRPWMGRDVPSNGNSKPRVSTDDCRLMQAQLPSHRPFPVALNQVLSDAKQTRAAVRSVCGGPSTCSSVRLHQPRTPQSPKMRDFLSISPSRPTECAVILRKVMPNVRFPSLAPIGSKAQSCTD